MKVEIPELKRCCCCLPLRYGLIGWGYIKLVLSMVFFGLAIVVIVRTVQMMQRHPDIHMFVEDLVVSSIFLLTMLLDICFTIVFLVGGYRKSAKLLGLYYIFNIGELSLFMSFFVWSTADMLYFIAHYIDHMPHGIVTFIAILQLRLLLGLSFIGAELYLILLVRSEMIKLRNNTNYRFTNPILRAQEDGTTNYPKPETVTNETDS